MWDEPRRDVRVILQEIALGQLQRLPEKFPQIGQPHFARAEAEHHVVRRLGLPDSPRRADQVVDVKVVRNSKCLGDEPRGADAVETERSDVAGVGVMSEHVDVPAFGGGLKEVRPQRAFALVA